MSVYRCPDCGDYGGWSGNMRKVHVCPGPQRRQAERLDRLLECRYPNCEAAKGDAPDSPCLTCPVKEQDGPR